MTRSILLVVWSVLRDAVGRFFQVNGLFLSSALAFSLLLYSVPMILLVVAALGQTLVGSERALAEVQSILRQLLPESEQQTVLKGLITAVDNRHLLGASGLLLFAVFSSTTFGSARFGLNVILGVERHRGFLAGLRLDTVMVFSLSGLFGLTVALNAALRGIRTAGDQIPLIGSLLHSAWFLVSEIMGTLFMFVLVYAVYRICPAERLLRSSLLSAAVTSTILLELFRWAFSWYVGAARNMTVIYGAVGSLFFFILWLYYAALVFFFGAAVGWAVEHRVGMQRSEASPDLR